MVEVNKYLDMKKRLDKDPVAKKSYKINKTEDLRQMRLEREKREREKAEALLNKNKQTTRGHRNGNVPETKRNGPIGNRVEYGGSRFRADY